MNKLSSLLRRTAYSALGLVCVWAGVVQAQTDFVGTRSSAFTYRADGLLETETIEPDDPVLCVVTTYHYDTWGNKDSATTSNCNGANGAAVFTTRSSGSTYASQSTTINVSGSAVAVGIPAGQFATNATNAKGHSESRTYDPRFGALISLTGPNGLTTTVQYDDWGRKAKETRADGTGSVSYYCILNYLGLDRSSNSPGCDGLGGGDFDNTEPMNAISFIHSVSLDSSGNAMGPAARVYKDRLGRTLRELSEAFDGANQPASRRLIAKDSLYNTYGVAYASTAPYFFSTKSSTIAGSDDVGLSWTTVDALGRPVFVDVADPQGSVTQFTLGFGNRVFARTTITYAGLSTTTTNPKGQTRTEDKNVDGKLVRVIDAYGATLIHQHDAFGNLIVTQDALNNLVLLSYDIRGRKTAMTDPDTGRWTYVYNALGELVRQQSPTQAAAGTVTTMVYDVLGRMTSRVEPEYTSTWTYDSCTTGVGRLCASSTDRGINKKVVYDSLGRPSNSRTTITNGPSFATAITYQSGTGRIATQTYPTGVKVQYAYTTRGFVTQLQLATPANVAPLPATPGGAPVAGKNLPVGTALWSAGTVNAWGKAESQSLDNGVVSRANFEPNTGRVLTGTAGKGKATDVLSHSYAWDSLNNLTARADNNGDGNTGAVNETFQYDTINRLKQYTVSAPMVPNLARTVDLYYNAVGNLLYKSDVGNYEYPASGSNGTNASNPKPHAVSRVAGTSFGTVDYGYDASGNMVNASGGKYRSVSYTSFNLPDSDAGLAGTAGGPRYTWQYDESHQRIKETRTNSSGTRTTWYQHPDNQGGLSFESETGPGSTSNRHYLAAGSQTLVLVTSGALPTLQTIDTAPPALASVVFVKVEYWHKDHLNSIAATTDHLGNVTARYAYDPFGKRRQTNGQYDAFGNLNIDWADNVNAGTDRGFTGHEHLDDVGVVHMNGRIFDPTIARFMQGDPLVQSPGNLQNYNRFSYCYNSPLTCTDPSGYSFWTSFRSLDPVYQARPGGPVDLSLAKLVYSGIRSLPGQRAMDNYVMSHPWAYTLGIAAAGYWGGPIAVAAIQGYAVYISGGTIESAQKSAITSLATSAAFYAVGSMAQAYGWSAYASVAAHAAVGCVSSEASGGSCRSGALSAGFSEVATVNNWQGTGYAGVVTAAVIGGTASVIGGGKFANGAVTAAMGYLFNCLSHGCTKESEGYETRRSGLNYGEAVDHWQNGNGMDVRVPLASLDLSHVAASDFPLGIGSTVVVNLSGRMGTNLSDQLVYGNVTLKLVAPGVVEAGLGYDRYNFDIKPWTSDTVGRNLATMAGSTANSTAATVRNVTLRPGQSFFIQLDGQAKIGPR